MRFLTRRLYSSAVFNDTFPEHGAPEIETTALDGVVLAMKSLAIDHVPNFPFPSPPPPDALLVIYPPSQIGRAHV